MRTLRSGMDTVTYRLQFDLQYRVRRWRVNGAGGNPVTNVMLGPQLPERFGVGLRLAVIQPIGVMALFIR